MPALANTSKQGERFRRNLRFVKMERERAGENPGHAMDLGNNNG